MLLYPESLPNPLAAPVRAIRMRGLPFSLVGDLDEAGRFMLDALLSVADSIRSA